MINDQNLAYLFSLKEENITLDTLYDLFSNRKEQDSKGNFVVKPPLFFANFPIIVKKGQLESVFEDTKTTVGRYIFNLKAINPVFHERVPYFNDVITKKSMGKFHQKITDMLIADTITPYEYGEWQRRVEWFDNLAEALTPGYPLSMTELPAPIKKEYDRLLKEHHECIEKNDVIGYITNIETPIVKFAKEWYMKNEPEAMAIFLAAGKPSFENNFKNMFLAVGPILDIATGKFRISTRSYSDGISPKEYELYTNASITGSYKRGFETQFGGAKTKEFTNSFQSVKVIEDDCHTEHYVIFDTTDENKQHLVNSFIKSKNGYMKVTHDNVDKLVGHRVLLRSPVLCATKKGFCSICAGDLFTKLGMKNVGTSLTRLPNNFLNGALKNMHDSTVSVNRYNPEDYIYEY